MIALFSPPGSLDGTALVAWFAVFAILSELFDSMLNANYGALPTAVLSHHGTATSHVALGEELTRGFDRLPAGCSELVMHPPAAGAAVPAVRELEEQLLRDPRWREALEARGIRQVAHW